MRQHLLSKSPERPPLRRDQIVTIEDLDHFQQELLQKFRHLLTEFSSSFSDGKMWLKTDEARKKLKCARTTLHTWRANGTIPFTKMGGTILYSAEAIEKVLQERMVLRRNNIHNAKSSFR